MNTKHTKQAHDRLVLSTIQQNDIIEADCNSCTATNILDYEQLYNNLPQEHELLKTKFSEQNLNQPEINYKSINKNLRFNIKVLQKNLNTTNSLLKENQKKMSKEIKILSQNQTKTVENQARKLVSSVFTENQIDLIVKKKKRVHWSREEVSKALMLRYISKKAYSYVKDQLHYPLPGLSCLLRWAKTIYTRNGISENGSSNEDKNKVEMVNDVVEFLASRVAKIHTFNIPDIGSTITQGNKNNIINTLGHDF